AASLLHGNRGTRSARSQRQAPPRADRDPVRDRRDLRRLGRGNAQVPVGSGDRNRVHPDRIGGVDMTTAAERGRANVARGKEAERQVARFLSVALGYNIIRHVRAGHRRAGDPGDLKLDDRLVCSVKDDLEVYRLPTWLDDLEAMDGRDT